MRNNVEEDAAHILPYDPVPDKWVVGTVDFDPVLEPRLNLPPCLPFILPVILTFLWLIFWVQSHSHTVTIGLLLMIVLKWGDFHPRNQSCISTDSGGYK